MLVGKMFNNLDLWIDIYIYTHIDTYIPNAYLGHILNLKK